MGVATGASSPDRERQMSDYVRFPVGDGGSILVEVDSLGFAETPEGVEKAGLRDFVRGKTTAVATAGADFADAVKSEVAEVARAVEESASGLVHAPNEIEVRFGLKAAAEVGHFAIAKAIAEANFDVSLKWVKPLEGQVELVDRRVTPTKA
jgi:hypothetical protein